MSSVSNNYLAITALGANSPCLINQFIQTISNCGSNILNTKITVMGSEFACCLFIAGNWGVVAKIEIALATMEKELEITTTIRRTSPQNIENKNIPYTAHIVTIDKTGILQEITKFFAKQNIVIEDISAHTYHAPNNTKMANISMNINLTEDVHIATLRDSFITYCDNLNLDASIEPLRY